VVPDGRVAPGEPPELAYLHDLAARLRGPAPWFDVVQDRRPANAIARYAGDRGDTIVVVATHGRSGLRDLIMGGVARGVAHQACCPVLVVPRRAGHRIA
jgi:nucleotide-binding universal stress UspA family protein